VRFEYSNKFNDQYYWYVQARPARCTCWQMLLRSWRAAAWQLAQRRATLERHAAERASQQPPSPMLGWLTLLRLLRLQ